MAKAKASEDKPPVRKRRPALTPEARENQLISLAVDLVEQRLINGTASAQETVHFLKLGSTEARVRKKLLEEQAKLAAAKTEAIEAAKDAEELYFNAIAAMKAYGGYGSDPDEQDVQ